MTNPYSMNWAKSVWIVIPAYNEALRIRQVIENCQKRGFSQIVVTDDCSTDDTFALAKSTGAVVLHHSINRGAGAATKTGIDYALSQNVDYIVTIDADGQHDPAEIEKLIEKAEKLKKDVIIGSRLIDSKGMPLIRLLYNRIGSLITYLLYGIYVRDSQSGFKVFSKNAAQKIKIKFDRFEFCSEVLYEIRRNRLSFCEIPISVIYTKESLAKGQSFQNGVKMVYRMIMRLLV